MGRWSSDVPIRVVVWGAVVSAALCLPSGAGAHSSGDGSRSVAAVGSAALIGPVAPPWTPNSSSANGFVEYHDWTSGFKDEYGMDVHLDVGTPISAPAAATVVAYQPCQTGQPCWDPGRLLIRLGDGSVVGFGHVRSSLKPNDSVAAGQQVATVGSDLTDCPNPPHKGCPHVEFMYDTTGSNLGTQTYFLPTFAVNAAGGCPHADWSGVGHSAANPCQVLSSFMHRRAGSPERIGYIDPSENFYAKEGSLSGGWTLEATGAKRIALSGDRIGYLDGSGNFYAKRGRPRQHPVASRSNGGDRDRRGWRPHCAATDLRRSIPRKGGRAQRHVASGEDGRRGNRTLRRPGRVSDCWRRLLRQGGYAPAPLGIWRRRASRQSHSPRAGSGIGLPAETSTSRRVRSAPLGIWRRRASRQSHSPETGSRIGLPAETSTSRRARSAPLGIWRKQASRKSLSPATGSAIALAPTPCT